MLKTTTMFACAMLFPVSVLAQTAGGLTCPSGKVEAKSFAAYYVPAKGTVNIFFYKDALSEEELDAQMAARARVDAGANAKGPGVGKPAKYHPYVFKAWTRVKQKPGATLNVADFAKSAYFSYTCESGKERTVNHDFKEREAKFKAIFSTVSIELKQGGKAEVAAKGGYDGAPKDKDPIKASWDIKGAGKVRTYE